MRSAADDVDTKIIVSQSAARTLNVDRPAAAGRDHGGGVHSYANVLGTSAGSTGADDIDVASGRTDLRTAAERPTGLVFQSCERVRLWRVVRLTRSSNRSVYQTTYNRLPEF